MLTNVHHESREAAAVQEAQDTEYQLALEALEHDGTMPAPERNRLREQIRQVIAARRNYRGIHAMLREWHS